MGLIANIAKVFEDLIPQRIGDSVARRTGRIEEGGSGAALVGLLITLFVMDLLGFTFDMPIRLTGGGLLGRVM